MLKPPEQRRILTPQPNCGKQGDGVLIIKSGELKKMLEKRL
jgi:hypothetical protein